MISIRNEWAVDSYDHNPDEMSDEEWQNKQDEEDYNIEFNENYKIKENYENRFYA